MIFTGTSSCAFVQELRAVETYRTQHNQQHTLCVPNIFIKVYAMYFRRLLIVGVGSKRLHFSKDVDVNLAINIFMSKFFIKHCTDMSLSILS